MSSVDAANFNQISIARNWKAQGLEGEPDPAWRFVEEHILPAHPDAQVTCLTRFHSSWANGCHLVRELDELLESHDWDLVVVDAVHTLSRRVEVVLRLIRQMQDGGIRFVAVEDGIDTSRLGPIPTWF